MRRRKSAQQRTRISPAIKRRDRRFARHRHPAVTDELEGEHAQGVMQPMLEIDVGAANRGVAWRLFGAAACGGLALTSMLLLVFLASALYEALLFLGMSGAFVLASFTLAMSARREEEVHQLAASLHALPPGRHEPGPHERNPMTDGAP